MPAVTQINTSKPKPGPDAGASVRFIRRQEVSRLTGLPKSSIYDLMSKGKFPQSIKLAGGKAVAWLLSDVESWMQQCLEAATNAKEA